MLVLLLFLIFPFSLLFLFYWFWCDCVLDLLSLSADFLWFGENYFAVFFCVCYLFCYVIMGWLCCCFCCTGFLLLVVSLLLIISGVNRFSYFTVFTDFDVFSSFGMYFQEWIICGICYCVCLISLCSLISLWFFPDGFSVFADFPCFGGICFSMFNDVLSIADFTVFWRSFFATIAAISASDSLQFFCFSYFWCFHSFLVCYYGITSAVFVLVFFSMLNFYLCFVVVLFLLHLMILCLMCVMTTRLCCYHWLWCCIWFWYYQFWCFVWSDFSVFYCFHICEYFCICD